MFVFLFSEMKLYFCTRASLLLRTICGVKPFRAYWDKKKNLLRLKHVDKQDVRGGNEGHWSVTRWQSSRRGPQIFTLSSARSPEVAGKVCDLKENPLTRNQQSQNQLDDGTRSSEDTR